MGKPSSHAKHITCQQKWIKKTSSWQTILIKSMLSLFFMTIRPNTRIMNLIYDNATIWPWSLLNDRSGFKQMLILVHLLAFGSFYQVTWQYDWKGKPVYFFCDYWFISKPVKYLWCYGGFPPFLSFFSSGNFFNLLLSMCEQN